MVESSEMSEGRAKECGSETMSSRPIILENDAVRVGVDAFEPWWAGIGKGVKVEPRETVYFEMSIVGDGETIDE